MRNKIRFISLSTLSLMVSLAVQAQQQPAATDEAQAPAGRGAEQHMQRFAELDSNTDGNVSYEEFRVAPMAAFEQSGNAGDTNTSREEALERRFIQLDSDANGLLTAAEMNKRLPGALGQRSQGDRPERGQAQGQRQGAQGQQQGAQRAPGLRNIPPEQREQMRERMQQMTPEQRERMRDQMQDRRRERQTQGDQSSDL